MTMKLILVIFCLAVSAVILFLLGFHAWPKDWQSVSPLEIAGGFIVLSWIIEHLPLAGQ